MTFWKVYILFLAKTTRVFTRCVVCRPRWSQSVSFARYSQMIWFCNLGLLEEIELLYDTELGAGNWFGIGEMGKQYVCRVELFLQLFTLWRLIDMSLWDGCHAPVFACRGDWGEMIISIPMLIWYILTNFLTRHGTFYQNDKSIKELASHHPPPEPDCVHLVHSNFASEQTDLQFHLPRSAACSSSIWHRINIDMKSICNIYHRAIEVCYMFTLNMRW